MGLGKHFTSLQLLDLENDRGTLCLPLFKRETTKTARGVFFFLDSTKIHERVLHFYYSYLFLKPRININYV